MSAYTEKVFTFNEFPTGRDISSIIKTEELDDWSLVGVEQRFNESVHAMVYQTQKYRYEVRFRRHS